MGVLLDQMPARAAGVPVEFAFSSGSGAAFTSLAVEARTSGSLIGDYDAVSNPAGTRTKPGLFGTFGSTENVAVASSVDLRAAGAPSVGLVGGLRMEIDPAGGSVLISDYSAEMASGPATLPLSATVVFEAFRTRQPTSTFPGGIPVTIPVGDAALNALSLRQAGSASGVLTPLAGSRHAFSAVLLLTLSGTVESLGSVVPFGPLPLPLTFSGEVELSGDSATLTSLATLTLDETQTLGEVLPPIPFALPTVLPPGGTASVAFNLTLNDVIANLNGQLTTLAGGTVVPEPGGAAVLAAAAMGLLARRRT
jgi:hypothetical protein